MKKLSSTARQFEQRRNFITSALVGGAGSLLVASAASAATEADLPDGCEELSAADPLYFYTGLAQKLQPAVIEEARKFENVVQTSQSQKLRELWVLSDKLKAQLPKRSNAHAAVERVNSLAYIGQTNAEAKPGYASRSRARFQAHAKSQSLIVEEILKAAASVPAGDVRISAKAWALLQDLLQKIKEIRDFQPTVEKARETFNTTLQNINSNITQIQAALMEASSSVVKGDKAAATSNVKSAIEVIKQLPGYDSSLKCDRQKPAVEKVINENEAALMTPNKFICMLDPGVFELIEKQQLAVPISDNRSRFHGVRMTPVAYVSSSDSAPIRPPDPQTVKAIVRDCFVSGSWWQVVAVAAVCLPLWSYPRSEHRKSLIYSALTSIPRGPNSKLWEAAYFLDRLRP